MLARGSTRSRAVVPWLVLAVSLSMTLVAAVWRTETTAAADARAVASAENHFRGLVNDHERRVESVAHSLELVLTGASFDLSDLSTTEGRLAQLGAGDLDGIYGYALLPANSTPVTLEGLGESVDAEILEALAAVAERHADDAAWATPLGTDATAPLAVGVTNNESGALVAVAQANTFLLGTQGHSDHGVTVTLHPTQVSIDEWHSVAPSHGDHSAEPSGHEHDHGDALTHEHSETPMFTSTSSVDVVGSPWILTITSQPGFLEQTPSQEGRAIAVLGTVLSLVLYTLLRHLISSRQRIEEEKWAAEDELRTSGERFEIGFDRSPIGVAELDSEGVIVRANDALATLLRRTKDDLLGSRLNEFVSDRHQAESEQRLRDVASRSSANARAEICYRVDGHHLWVHESASAILGPDGTNHLLVQIVDFTEEQRTREELHQRALHDDLTGLPNRALLDDRIAQALIRGQRTGTLTAAIFIDVDRFKHVNDTLGHTAGDRLLQHLANRLVRQSRESDTVARFGGDEFVVLCEDLSRPEEAEELATRLREAIVEPVRIGDHTIPITVSMGIAVERDGSDPETLLRDADVAMYQAKEEGRDRVLLFELSMRESLVDRLELEQQLRAALDENQFRVHYQPIVRLESGMVSGFEALVRWQHPTRGLLTPADFVAVAERVGILIDIDRWVLATATAQLVAWDRQHCEAHEWTMAVNASPTNFGDRAYPSMVRDALAECGLAPSRLTIELTEEAVLSNTETAAEVILELRSIGVRVAIDDFGTGYSSFSQLAELDFDVLKIDRSFVQKLGDSSGNEIVQAVIQMARGLGLPTVAEGVESLEDLEQLRGLGSDLAQGYVVAKPMPPEDVVAHIAELAARRRQSVSEAPADPELESGEPLEGGDEHDRPAAAA